MVKQGKRESDRKRNLETESDRQPSYNETYGDNLYSPDDSNNFRFEETPDEVEDEAWPLSTK